MISFTGRAILLDIEGTTSSLSFVYDVLFPFARRHLHRFVEEQWGSDAMVKVRNLLAGDVGVDESDLTARRFCDEASRLMDADVKATGLKQLQGLIWQQGYESGELKSHVYDDVPPALKRWRDAGLELRIFSSGSIGAQKLFFAHTEQGDLLHFFSGHYDTTTGPKREATSYAMIARDMNQRPERVLFLSDVVEELDAARDAGMQTGLLIRPGNRPVADLHDHPLVPDFTMIECLPA